MVIVKVCVCKVGLYVIAKCAYRMLSVLLENIDQVVFLVT